jgi:hypothetical protein
VAGGDRAGLVTARRLGQLGEEDRRRAGDRLLRVTTTIAVVTVTPADGTPSMRAAGQAFHGPIMQRGGCPAAH